MTIFSAPNYCGEFDNAGAMMSVDDSLTCSFQILKASDKKGKGGFGSSTQRPGTPPHKVKTIVNYFIRMRLSAFSFVLQLTCGWIHVYTFGCKSETILLGLTLLVKVVVLGVLRMHCCTYQWNVWNLYELSFAKIEILWIDKWLIHLRASQTCHIGWHSFWCSHRRLFDVFCIFASKREKN